MANSWLRLWHELPSDPKFRTIAKIAKRPLSEVIAVYINLLVDASRNVTRGNVTVTDEDLASAIDAEIEDIRAIINAMQGRLLDDGHLKGWESRQVVKEDSDQAKSSANRQKSFRERQKLKLENDDVTNSNAKSQNITLDKDKDKDITNSEFEQFYLAYPKKKSKKDAEKAWIKNKPSLETILKTLSWQKTSSEWISENGKYIPYPASYLNAGSWQDEQTTQQPKIRGLSL